MRYDLQTAMYISSGGSVWLLDAWRFCDGLDGGVPGQTRNREARGYQERGVGRTNRREKGGKEECVGGRKNVAKVDLAACAKWLDWRDLKRRTILMEGDGRREV